MKRTLLSLAVLLAFLPCVGCNEIVGEAYLQATKGDEWQGTTFTVTDVTRADIHESYANYPNRQVYTVNHDGEIVYLYCTATFVKFPIAGEKEYKDCPAMPNSGTVFLEQDVWKTGGGFNAGSPWILRYKTTEGYAAYSALNLTNKPSVGDIFDQLSSAQAFATKPTLSADSDPDCPFLKEGMVNDHWGCSPDKRLPKPQQDRAKRIYAAWQECLAARPMATTDSESALGRKVCTETISQTMDLEFPPIGENQ